MHGHARRFSQRYDDGGDGGRTQRPAATLRRALKGPRLSPMKLDIGEKKEGEVGGREGGVAVV